MYRPEVFREDRIDVLHEMMRQVGVATIVGAGPDGLMATHVPVEIDPHPAPWGTLRCHFARPNPHAEFVADGSELLVIFQGPEGYVTPTWYPTKQVSGKVVPTWNYVAVHAYGNARTFEGPVRLRPHLAALTQQFEAPFEERWSIDDAPPEFIDVMCQAIVGVEIRLSRIEGKRKLSQNRGEQDREGVVRGLRAKGDDASRALADLVEGSG
jgi:transcriptional regulator